MADGDMADGQTVCRVLNALPALLDLADFAAGQVAEEPCRFDHHGGCQEHGYLSLDLGELCPNEMARRALAALGMQP